MQVQLSLCCFFIYSLSYLFIYFLNAVSPFLALIVWSLKVTVETEALPSPPPQPPTEGSVLWISMLKYILLPSELPVNINSFFSLFSLSELGPKITPGCSLVAGTYSKFCNLRGPELSWVLDNFS